MADRWIEATVRFAADVPDDDRAADQWADDISRETCAALEQALADHGLYAGSVEVVDWMERADR